MGAWAQNKNEGHTGGGGGGVLARKKRQRHGGRRFCRLEVAETDTDLTLVYITRGGSGYMFLCFLPAVADWSDGCKGANVGGF